MSSHPWRLILDPPSDGERNMAIDACLLEEAVNGAPPTLRLYGWERPTLSIGYAQPLDEIDTDAAARFGVPIVRRPTGGRAVYHHKEVTYAVALGESAPHYGSLREIYMLAEKAIEDALRELGVPVDLEPRDASGVRSACCFSSRTRHEITVGGKKVVGSAQRRVRGGALQHGSVILSMDTKRYLSLMRWKDDAERNEAAALIGGINDGRLFGLSATKVRDTIVASFARLHDAAFERPVSML
ncbi:MAG: lipoate--protein ligase family protein [Nitrospinae bacterium]|nr:lipoate--protein ligase family protein [Nitrospinota bacterium]